MLFTKYTLLSFSVLFLKNPKSFINYAHITLVNIKYKIQYHIYSCEDTTTILSYYINIYF